MCGIDKLLYKINDKEVILYSIEAFAKAKCVTKIVIVTSKEKLETVKELVSGIDADIEVCTGSDERQKSVLNGLALCDEKSECIMIHDAARPMITAEKIDFLYEKIIGEGLKAAALGVPVKDTIKVTDESGKIIETPKRETLYITQTPQGFESSLYKKAFEKAISEGKSYTDDCQLVEALGESVYMVEGDYKNIKITTPEDIITAQNFLKEN